MNRFIEKSYLRYQFIISKIILLKIFRMQTKSKFFSPTKNYLTK